MKFDPTKLVLLQRPRFLEGKFMTADDFRAEQEYHLQRQWQHNRLLHGYGIVVGLEVGIQANDEGSTQLIVSPGYALDGWGRELVVPEPVSIFLPGDRHDLTIFVKYVEPAQDDDSEKSIAEHAAPILERARVMFEPSSAERALAPTARPDYAVPIARIRRPHQHWQRDKDFRPPRAK